LADFESDKGDCEYNFVPEPKIAQRQTADIYPTVADIILLDIKIRQYV
jgi:hypothetical protein